MSERKRGQPTKCTPEMIADIAQRVSEGVSLSRSAEGAGSSSTRVSEWMQRGEEGEEPYAGFREAIIAAEHGFELKNLKVIQRAATDPTITTVTKKVFDKDGNVVSEDTTITERPPTWTPSAWLLERRFAAHYARLEKRHHEGAVPVAEQGPREVRITLVEAPKAEPPEET